MARLGLGARAFVYLCVSAILLDGVFTGESQEGVSPSEAFTTLEPRIGGHVLLTLVAIGLGLYALWRFQQAVFDADNRGNDAAGILARLGMMSSGISYLLVGIAAFTVSFGTNQDNGGSGATQMTVSWLLSQPLGRWLVALAGLALAGVGCAQVWRAAAGQWKKHLDLNGWPQKLAPLVTFGIAARGLIFVMVGGFIILAGTSAQPEQVRGLAGALTWLRFQPFGFWLFLGTAIAILAYGLYSAIQSLRYRFPDQQTA